MISEQSESIRQTRHAELVASHSSVRSLFSALDDAQWQTVVFADGVWYVSDMLRHLLAAEASMVALIRNICAGGSGSPADFDLNRWNARQVEKQRAQTPAELLARIDPTHQATLDLLAAMQPDDWERRGRHAGVGETTVAHIFSVIAQHNQLHVGDVRVALAQ